MLQDEMEGRLDAGRSETGQGPATTRWWVQDGLLHCSCLIVICLKFFKETCLKKKKRRTLLIKICILKRNIGAELLEGDKKEAFLRDPHCFLRPEDSAPGKELAWVPPPITAVVLPVVTLSLFSFRGRYTPDPWTGGYSGGNSVAGVGGRWMDGWIERERERYWVSGQF